MPERGKYIVLEGGDGTGKSTQAIILDSFVRSLGYDTLQTVNDETGELEPIQEPGGTPQADILRRRIKDKTIPREPWDNVEWFTEARQYIWRDAIEPALESGKHVITARSWLSTMAYQGYGEGISLQDIEQYTRDHVGDAYLEPDFVAILAIKSEQDRKRRLLARGAATQLDSQADTFESKPAEFQASMQDGYLQLAEERGIPIIDASGSRIKVFRDILKHVEPLF